MIRALPLVLSSPAPDPIIIELPILVNDVPVSLPINTLLLAVVICEPILEPIKTLLIAVVAVEPVLTPIQILSLPSVKDHPAASFDELLELVEPTKILRLPEYNEYPDSLPMIVLYEPSPDPDPDPEPYVALCPIIVLQFPDIL